MKMRIIFICFATLFSFNLWATEVAVLDFRVAVLQSDAGKAAVKGPQAKIDAMEQQLKQEQTEIEDMSAALKRDELTLTKEEYQAKQQQIMQRNTNLRNTVANMQRQAQQMEQQLLQSLKEPAEAALKKIIEEKKLDLVLNRQGSIFSAAGVDITNNLTQKMNEAK